ncbi:MAG: hypothetical protein ACUVTD_08125, partial [Nitrososphaerales archaeon]
SNHRQILEELIKTKQEMLKVYRRRRFRTYERIDRLVIGFYKTLRVQRALNIKQQRSLSKA